MILKDVVRTLPSGAPIAAGTEVRIYRERDNALLGTVTTDAKGMFEFETAGNPGIVRYEAIVGSGKKVHSTRSILPVADLDLSSVRPLLSTFLDGVVVNYKDALAVEADGLAMKVTVGAGVAAARGVLYRQDDAMDITIPSATTNPRLDVIAVRFWLDEGGDNAGRCELVRKAGTEAVTPVAPALEQTSSVWETPLARVRVDPGVIGIAMGKVTDTRLIAMPFIPDGSITKNQLSDDVTLGLPEVREEGGLKVENVTTIDVGPGFTWTTPQYGYASLHLDRIGNGSHPGIPYGDHFHLFPRPSIVTLDFAPTGILSSGERELKSTTFTYPSGRLLTVRATLRVRLRGSAAGASYYRPSITINGSTRTAPAGDQGFWCVQGVPDMCVWTHTFPVTATGAAQTVSAKIMHHAGSFYIDRGELEVEIFSER